MYMNFDKNHSPNVLENQTRLQNSAYTTRKSLSVRVLYALFEQIPFAINRDNLKNPTLCWAKNSNELRLCALFEQIPSGINRDIQKNPTCVLAELKIVTHCAPSHLVTWIPHTV